MKLIIRNSNGEITEQEITGDLHLSPSAGEQYFFTGVENYTFNLTNGDSTLDIHFLDNNGDRVNIVLHDMAGLIQQNDPLNPFSQDTSFGISTNQAGDQAIEKIMNNSELESGEIVEALKEALSMDGTTIASGAVIDDFQALLDGLDATATGETQDTAYHPLSNDNDEQDVTPTQSNNQERPDSYENDNSGFDRSSDNNEYTNNDPSLNITATLNVNEDGSKTVSFTTDDIDGDSVTVNANASNGTVSIENGEITYIPDENFNGSDTITVSVDDGNGGVVTKTIDVTVDPVNDAPTIEIVGQTTVSEDGSKTVSFTTDDIDGDTVTVNANASNGTVIVENGEITYTPNENFNGNDTITVSVDDGNGGVVTKTIDVTVDPINDAPTVKAIDTVYVNEDGMLSGRINASDFEGDSLTFSTDSEVEGLTLNSDGTYTFDADSYDSLDLGENQILEIPVIVSDGNGGEAQTTLTIDVAGVNNDITYVSESAGYKNVIGYYELDDNGNPTGEVKVIIDDQNGMVSGTHLDDLDPNAEYGFFIIANGANEVDENSVLTFDNSGDVPVLLIDGEAVNKPVYHDTPSFNADGKDHFIFESDGEGGTTIKIEDLPDLGDADFQDVVLNVNFEIADKLGDDVQAKNDTVTTDEDNVVVIDVLGNDVDGTGNTLTITNIQSPVMLNGVEVGTAEVIDGKISFTPNDELDKLSEGETQNISFNYTVSDGNLGEDTATVTLKVQGTNDAPVIEITDTTATEDTTQIIANVSDIDGTIESSNLVAQNGTVELDENGNITYTPNENFNGTDSVTISVTDNNGAVTTQTFDVTVENVNDGPVAVDNINFGEATLEFEATHSGDHRHNYLTSGNEDDILSGGAGNDVLNSNNGDDIIIGGAGDDRLGGLNGNDTAVYSGSHDDYTIIGNTIIDNREGSPDGIDTLNSVEILQFSDGQINMTTGIFTEGAMTEGIDYKDAIAKQEDTEITINANELLANDTDADGDSLTITAVNTTENTHGTVSLDEDGNVVFTPDTNYNGEASFTYTISDGNGGSDTATVSLNVISVNDEPTIEVQSTATLNEDGSLTISADNWSASDVEDGSLTPNLSAENGSVEIVDGNIVYTPNENYNGSDTITVSVTDSNGATTTETINVTVEAVNDAITQVTDSDNTQNAIDENVEDGTYTGVTLNATDIDGDTITYSLPDDVPFKVLENGQIVTDGAIDFESNESFTFTATATSSDGTQSTTEVTVNVNDIEENSGPVATNDIDSVDEDSSITVDVLANDTDADGDSLTITQIQGQDVVNNGDTVNVTVDGNVVGTAGVVNNEIVFTPAQELQAMHNGDETDVTFEYTISDGTATDSASVTINVTGSDDDEIINIEGDVNDDSNNVEEGDYVGDLATHSGNDRVTIGDDIADGRTVSTNDGNDTVIIGDDVKEQSTLDTGAGDDVVTIHGDITNNSSVIGGEGRDILNLTSITKEEWDADVKDDVSGFETVNLADGVLDTTSGEFVSNGVNELTDSDNTENVIDENVADGTYTGVTLNAIDGDGDTITYSIPDDVPFRVENDGKVVVDGDNAIDFESNESFTFTATATSADGTQSTTEVTINVNDISELTTFSGDRADYTISQETIEGEEQFVIRDIETGDVSYVSTSEEEIKFNDGIYDTTSENFDLDQVNIESGDSNIISGTGDDSINTGTGNDTIDAGDGRNSVRSGAGNDTITTGDGDDDIHAGSGDDVIHSGDGGDYILGQEGDDTIYSGAGSDQIVVGTGDDYVDAGEGTNDTVIFNGNSEDFNVTKNDDGSYTVEDIRDGSPEGTDTIVNVEFIRFDDTINRPDNFVNQDPIADELSASIEVGDVTENTTQQVDLDAVQEQGLIDNGDGTYSQTTYEDTAKLYKTEEIEIGDAAYIRLDDAPEHGTVEVNLDDQWSEIVIGQEYDADIGVRFIPNEDALSNTKDIGIGTFGDNVGESNFSETIQLSDWGEVAEDGRSITYTDGDLSVTTSVIQNGSEQQLGTYNSSGNAKGAGIGDQDGQGLSRGEVMRIEFSGEDINQVEFQLDGLGGYFDEDSHKATEVKITAYDNDGNEIDTQGGYRQSGEYDDVYSFTTTVPVAHFELTTEGSQGNYVVQNMTLSKTVVDEVTFTAISDDGSEMSLTSDINIEAGMGTTNIGELVPVSDVLMTKEVRVVDEEAMAEKGAIQVDGTWVVETGTEIVDTPMMDVVESLEYPVDLSAELSDTDGSESLSVTITGVPDGAELSVGTDNGDGTWSIDVADGETSIDLNDVTLTLPVGSESFELGIEATATESSTGDTRTVTDSDAVTVPELIDESAEAPTLDMNIGEATVTTTETEGVSIKPDTPEIADTPDVEGATEFDSVSQNNYHSINTTEDTVIVGDGYDAVTVNGGNDNAQIGDADSSSWTSINAGNGDNTISAGENWDEITTGSGHDNITVDDGAGVINSGSGNDIITAGDGDTNAYAAINGGDGNNDITAGDNWDKIATGSGNDTIDVGDGVTLANLGSGNDHATFGDGGVGHAKLDAGDGNDTILGGDEWDQVNLRAGNDQLQVGDGSSYIDGGTGNDTIIAGDAATDRWSQVQAGGGNDNVILGDGFERVGLGDGNDNLNVGNADISQWTNIDAGSGNDTITVGHGYDKINGGAGDDTVIFKGDASEYEVGDRWGNTIVTHNETGSITELQNVENIQFDGEDAVLGGDTTITYTYPVDFNTELTDTDGSETLSDITVDNLPEGVTLSGTGVIDNGDGTYSISADENDNYANDIQLNSDNQLSSELLEDITASITAIEESSNDTETTTVTADVEADIQTAVLVDGVVEGAEYETTSGIRGITDENGNFNYREGDSVTFNIGGVVLGVATAEDIASGQTFLQDIADVERTNLNDEYLENMATFLQSIDSDSGDNIVITEEMRESLTDASIDLRTASEEEVASLVESVGGTYVSEAEAMEHVQEMLEEYAGIDENEFEEHVTDDILADNEEQITSDIQETIGESELLSATFSTSVPEGITFETSSGMSGTIGDDGQFNYNEGDTIIFKDASGEVIAQINADMIGDDNLITMQELVSSIEETEAAVDEAAVDEAAVDEAADSFEDSDVDQLDLFAMDEDLNLDTLIELDTIETNDDVSDDDLGGNEIILDDLIAMGTVEQEESEPEVEEVVVSDEEHIDMAIVDGDGEEIDLQTPVEQSRVEDTSSDSTDDSGSTVTYTPAGDGIGSIDSSDVDPMGF